MPGTFHRTDIVQVLGQKIENDIDDERNYVWQIYYTAKVHFSHYSFSHTTEAHIKMFMFLWEEVLQNRWLNTLSQNIQLLFLNNSVDILISFGIRNTTIELFKSEKWEIQRFSVKINACYKVTSFVLPHGASRPSSVATWPLELKKEIFGLATKPYDITRLA